MDFARILARHTERYPLMDLQDYGKLAFQSEFGPEHLVEDEELVRESILKEWREMPPVCSPGQPEYIGNALCRFPLSALKDEGDARLLARLFVRTAREHRGTKEGLARRLELLGGLDVPGMAQWLAQYQQVGCPAVRHSEAFRRVYNPHYRLLKREYALYFPVLREAERLLQENRPTVLAIDGRCGSGKSSLGRLLEGLYSCTLVHMDDFYMPPEQRMENWMEVPAANMDLARFEREVLRPAGAGEEILYRPFLCGSGDFAQGTVLPGNKLTVVEGSYSHHPTLAGYYDRTIFLTCPKQEQLRRLEEREGDYFPRFLNIWMPLEERYFQAFGIEENAQLVVNTGAAL